MIEEMVQNVLDIHDNGWSSEAERNDTLPMSTDQAFYEMLRKNAPAHDGNKKSDQIGPAYKKVRSFPETFEISTRAQGKWRAHQLANSKDAQSQLSERYFCHEDDDKGERSCRAVNHVINQASARTMEIFFLIFLISVVT
jgi:hypothetical protein